MISVVILTKNEKKNIIDCIQSVDWCDEIVVIDDYSDDDTIQSIEKLDNKKVKIYKHHLQHDFAAQRNFGMSKAQGDWILFVDSDERVSVSLQYEILSTISSSIENYSGYYIKRKDIMWGKPIRFGESGQIKILRLARKGSGEWSGKVHEIWNVTGKIGTLKNSLIHHPHPDIATFLKEINFYTTVRAEELYSKHVKTNMWSIVLYPIGKFIQNYIFKLGIFDGIRGLVFAILMSFHSFLVRGKLWQLWQKKKNF